MTKLYIQFSPTLVKQIHNMCRKAQKTNDKKVGDYTWKINVWIILFCSLDFIHIFQIFHKEYILPLWLE